MESVVCGSRGRLYRKAEHNISLSCDALAPSTVYRYQHAPGGDERFGQRHWRKQHGTGGHTALGLTLPGAATKVMNLQLKPDLSPGIAPMRGTASNPSRHIFRPAVEV